MLECCTFLTDALLRSWLTLESLLILWEYSFSYLERIWGAIGVDGSFVYQDAGAYGGTAYVGRYLSYD